MRAAEAEGGPGWGGVGGGHRRDWVRGTVLTFAGPGREFVEREVTDFARRNPGVVVYVNPRPCAVPRIVAEYREWGRARWGGRAGSRLARWVVLV